MRKSDKKVVGYKHIVIKSMYCAVRTYLSCVVQVGDKFKLRSVHAVQDARSDLTENSLRYHSHAVYCIINKIKYSF